MRNVKRLSFFGQIKSGKIVYFVSIIVLLICSGCGKDDGLSGSPYKFRLEITADEPETMLYLNNCIYNTYDENGRTNPVYITWLEDFFKLTPSSITAEFEVPRNFDEVLFATGANATDVMVYPGLTHKKILQKNVKLSTDYQQTDC